MIDIELALPGVACSVSAPSALVEVLERFYPLSVERRSAPGRPAGPTHSFRIIEEAQGWTLLHGDVRTGTFSEASYALLALECEIEQAVTSVDDGRFALHAGAVETARGAWLIAGEPDSGKTSSTFQLLQLGQRFMCEEIALYDPDSHTIHPYLQTPTLERRYTDRFSELYPVREGSLWPIDESVVRFVPDRISSGPVTLQALLLPRYRPGAAPEIEALRSEDVLTELLGYCFRPAAGDERLFDAIIALLERTQLLRVTYGSITTARKLYCDLLESRSEGH